MEFILSLYTVGPQNSVALRGPGLEWTSELGSRELVSQLPDVFGAVEARVPASSRLDVVVCPGPGSFTGIRIGIAAAQGYCRARGSTLWEVQLSELFLSKERTGDFLCLDGHNGYFSIAHSSSESFELLPYPKVSEFLERETPKRLLGFQADCDKFINLGSGKFDQTAKFERISLDGAPLALLMANHVYSEVETLKKYSLPRYGLPAFVNLPKLGS